MPKITRKYIGTTKNNCAVSVDTVGSHAATHLKEQQRFGLWKLTQEAVGKIAVLGDNFGVQVDMGRVVGEMDLVETTPEDTIIYGMRRNRTWHIPFVKRDKLPKTPFVTMVLKQATDEQLRGVHVDPKLRETPLCAMPQYDLFTTYIGVQTPGLPGGDPGFVTAESLPFWTTHALVLGTQKIDQIYPGVPPEFRT